MDGMRFDIRDLYNELTKEGIIFCFCGPASQLIVEGIGETLLQRIRLEGTDTGVVGRVFQVFVEQMQNIVSHSAERVISEGDEGQLRVGIVVVGREKDRFYVRCGNFVENEQAESMRDRLAVLQAMEKDQLKTLYKEALRQAETDSGAKMGLGFIAMARKASEPINFEITRIDETRSFFTMTTII